MIICLCVVSMAIIYGCGNPTGGGGGSASQPVFAYVVNSGSNNISAYTINENTGALTSIGSFPAGNGPDSSAVGTSGKFLYVANYNDNDISIHSINPRTGALTMIGTIAAGTNPVSAVIDATFECLYVANINDNNVSGYSIDAVTGTLEPLSNSPLPACSHPHWLNIDPSGKYLYALSLDDTKISGYSVDPGTGNLSSIVGSPFSPPYCAYQGVIDPSGKYFYAPTASNGANVLGYKIHSETGSLEAIPTQPFPGNGGYATPIAIAVTPSGKWLFVSDSTFGNTHIYSIDAPSGILSEISVSPYYPSSAAFQIFDPSGKFLYQVGVGIAIYKINSTTGTMEPVGSANTGSTPVFMSIRTTQ